jgi:hypothetical protein
VSTQAVRNHRNDLSDALHQAGNQEHKLRDISVFDDAIAFHYE